MKHLKIVTWVKFLLSIFNVVSLRPNPPVSLSPTRHSLTQLNPWTDPTHVHLRSCPCDVYHAPAVGGIKSVCLSVRLSVPWRSCPRLFLWLVRWLRTADPSADGHRCPASRTAIGGGHIVSPAVTIICFTGACIAGSRWMLDRSRKPRSTPGLLWSAVLAPREQLHHNRRRHLLSRYTDTNKAIVDSRLRPGPMLPPGGSVWVHIGWNDVTVSTGWTKKRGHRLMTMILSNPNRFKKFFHRKIPWKICS